MSLAEYIAEQLVEEGLEVSSEQIQGYIDAHAELQEEAPAPKAKGKAAKSTPAKVAPKAKAPAKAAKGKSKEKVAHTCERTINGKDGSRICGKTANNELNDMWFCGTEKSGCYKSALGKAPAPKGKSAAPKAKTVAKGASKGKASAVVQKVQKKERLNLVEVPAGSGVWVDLNHFRMVYSQDPKETYGLLDEDDETVLPLTEEAINFAEAHNIPIREAAPKSKGKAKGKAVAKSTPAKAKAAPKGKAKTAPPAKTAKTPAKAKAAPKGKAKASKKAVDEDEEVLEELQQDAEDVEVEPEVEEEEDAPVEEEEEVPEIDLGDEDAGGADEEEEPNVEEEDEDEPDIEEADEGEAADDGADEEEEEGDEE